MTKEKGRFYAEDEFRDMDGMLLETNSEIMKKAGEIWEILGKRDHAVSSLRKAYSLVVEALKEKDEELQMKKTLLEKEEQEKQGWIDKYRVLQEQNKTLEEKLNGAKQEKEMLQNRIRQLEQYQTLQEEFEQIRRDCNQHYTDAKHDRDEARSELKQCREELEKETEKVIHLQETLEEEIRQREDKEREVGQLNSQLLEKEKEIHTLKEIKQQYRWQRQKMPILMGVFDAYSAIMEKRDQLPREFFECLQKAMPVDDFDRFVFAALNRSFPISCYLSLKSFIAVSGSGQVPEKAMKEALRCSDRLLEEVFVFGSEYFKEEKLFRIELEKGDPFEDDVCTYINGRGGMYGDIADVWLHGLRDEKDDRIYHSYVEGE